MDTIKSKILETVERVIDKQNSKGLKTYGQTLDDCPINDYDWQHMIIEELIDALQYQQKEIDKIKMNRTGDERMNMLKKKIEMWSSERDLHVADPDKQFYKIIEEMGEVAGAKARGNIDEMKVELGDVLVTLIIFAQQQDIDLKQCLELAYEKIMNRNGKMINGVYVKEEDLHASH